MLSFSAFERDARTTDTPRTVLKENKSWTFSRPVFTCRRTMFRHELLSRRAHCNYSIVTFCCVSLSSLYLATDTLSLTPGLDNELCALNREQSSLSLVLKQKTGNKSLHKQSEKNHRRSSEFTLPHKELHTKEGEKQLCKAECHVTLIKLHQCSTEGAGGDWILLVAWTVQKDKHIFLHLYAANNILKLS